MTTPASTCSETPSSTGRPPRTTRRPSISTAVTSGSLAQRYDAAVRASPDAPGTGRRDHEDMKISELMHRDVVTVAPTTSLKDAASLLGGDG